MRRKESVEVQNTEKLKAWNFADMKGWHYGYKTYIYKFRQNWNYKREYMKTKSKKHLRKSTSHINDKW